MDIIYGINPIIESLRDEATRVRKIIIARGKTGAEVGIIADLAVRHGIPILFEDRSVINGMAAGGAHQGIAALCRPYKYRSVDEVIANHPGPMKNNLILILDNITDPHNLGSIIRTAHCFGINGVIIPKNRAAGVTPAVVKASAGAANHTQVAMVTNLSETIKYLKGKGFWIYGADGKLGKDIAASQDLG
ncbi:MAG: RNA methyltransferase, partial [Smithellaceae bacterium]|nr:RNA methyltransferase [Smithellaceae bacterium]